MKNNQVLTFVLSLGLLAIVYSCSGSGSDAKPKSTKDCGKDFKCLVEAAENKQPAKIQISESLEDIAGSGSIEGFFEIKNYNEDSISFYLRYDKINLELGDMKLDTLGEMEKQFAMGLIQMMQGIFKELEGKDANCKAPQDKVVDALKSWEKNSAGALSGMADLTTGCSGSLVDAINDLGSKMGGMDLGL